MKPRLRLGTAICKRVLKTTSGCGNYLVVFEERRLELATIFS